MNTGKAIIAIPALVALVLLIAGTTLRSEGTPAKGDCT